MTESVRGDGGVLLRFGTPAVHVRLHPGVLQQAETADNIEEADRWYEDKRNNRRHPNCYRGMRWPGP